MFAIIATGGKQYRVQEGDTLLVEKLALPTGKEAGTVTFDNVLMVGEGDNLMVGTPTVPNATVQANVLEPIVAGKKVIAFKYARKERYHRKVGHRQKYTKVQIKKIVTKKA